MSEFTKLLFVIGGLVIVACLGYAIVKWSETGAIVGLAAVLSSFLLALASHFFHVDRSKKEDEKWEAEQQFAKKKLEADLYLKYKLEVIRELHKSLVDTVNKLGFLGGRIFDTRYKVAVLKNEYDEVVRKVDSFNSQILVAHEFLDDEKVKGIIRHAGVELKSKLSLLGKKIIPPGDTPRKEEFDEWLGSYIKPIQNALNCLGYILNPTDLRQEINIDEVLQQEDLSKEG